MSSRPSILVTAGPTRERIDPVRFISNYSTGTFGHEIAREAARRKMRVTLVSGPTVLKKPAGVRVISVESAIEMKRAVDMEFKKCDCLIMAAAVSDWRVRNTTSKKIKRHGQKASLELVENPDILAGLADHKSGRTIVGFALETENLEKNAIRKLKDKTLDIIIANKLDRQRKVLGNTKTSVLIIDRFGRNAAYKNRTKRELAKIILDKALSINIG